ncbi:DMT family transporter [Prescottella agglutinans]|uniref:Small multidrug resistance pump n=1 Tax=Prescottella agglutinans TaxID=1644129 RepID=A0ABT6MIC4_9NOCA|nr:multidrug efflux SMR transporter [Prescottella agglutinans]MDH6283619.1 small multidrug resistance pump [Prescottella agglutinans]
MNAYGLLAGAIACEIVATLSLKAADGFSRLLPSVIVVIGYASAFALLGFALQRGLSVGVGYAIWSAVGTTVVAILGVLFFKESLSLPAIAGIALIVVGVVLIELGSNSTAPSPEQPDSTAAVVGDH